MAKKRYIVNGEHYTIPFDKDKEFRNTYPDAEEVHSYDVEGEAYHIPISQEPDFLRDKPSAKALGRPIDFVSTVPSWIYEDDTQKKNKNSGSTPEVQESESKELGSVPNDTPNGFRTVQPHKLASVVEANQQTAQTRVALKSMLPQIEKTIEDIDNKAKAHIGDNAVFGFGKEQDDLLTARRYLQKAKKVIESPGEEGVKGFVAGLRRNDLANFLSLGYTDAYKSLKTAKIAKRIEAGDEPTDEEYLLLAGRYLYDLADANKDKTSSYNIGNAIAEMAPFLGQIYLTSPVGAAASKGASATATKIISKEAANILKKYGLDDVLKMTATSAAQAPLTAMMWQKYGEKRLPILEMGEDGKIVPIEGSGSTRAESVMESFGSTMSSIFSEKAGEFIKGRVTTMGKNLAPTMDNPAKALKSINSFRKDLNWSGAGYEFLEEQIDGVGQAITTEDASLSDLFDSKRQFETLATIMVASGAMKALEIPGYFKEKHYKKELEKATELFEKSVDPQTRKVIDSAINMDSVDDMQARLKDEDVSHLTPDQQKVTLGYMQAKLGYNTLFEAANTKLEPLEGTKTKSEPKVSPQKESVSALGSEPVNTKSTSEIQSKNQIITLSDKIPASANMKYILSTGDENVFTRRIDKNGKEFGEITIKEMPEGWMVKRVDVNEERKGFGKDVYRQLNKQALIEGKTIISDAPDRISGKARYMWESLVKSGEAAKDEDGSYRMLSSIKEIPPVETKTPEIESFTAQGGNKVIDDKGQPLTVYHGTKANFTDFDEGRIGQNDPGVYGKGIYFSASKFEAAKYGGQDYDNVKPFNVSIKNPYILDFNKGTAEGRKVLSGRDIPEGYDGVIVYENGVMSEIVVKSKDQIKNIGEQTNANAVESTAQVPLGETPGDRGTVREGNEGQIPPGESQETQAPQEAPAKITDPEIAVKLKDFATKIRQGKISKIQGFKSNTPFGLAWDGALEVLATSLDTTADITIAVNKALSYIKDTDWYKGLSIGRRKEFEDQFIDHINNESGMQGTSENPKLSGIKKGLVPEEKIAETEIGKRTFVQMLDKGKQMVDSGEILPATLIRDIINKPRALQADEVSSLVYHKARLDTNFDNIYDRLEEAKDAGDTEQESVLRTQLDAISKEIDDYHEVSLITAYEQSLAFNLRKMLLDNEYNLQTQVRRYKSINKGEIPPDVEAKFRDYEKQLQEVNKKLRDLEKRKADIEGNEYIKSIDESVRQPRQKRGKDLMAEGFQDLMQAIGGMQMAAGDNSVSITQALSKIGRGLIDEGIATIDNVAEKIKEFIAEKYKGEFKVDIDAISDDIKNSIKEFKGKPEIVNGKLKIPQDIIRDYVAGGMDDINNIVTAIKTDFDLEATDREIRDAITDYGKTLTMSKDDISVRVRELKRMGKTISGLEDVIQEKKKPLRSGLQRDKLTDRERRLQKELRDAMKDLPQSEEEIASAWKSALDGVKTRLKNQIADLQNQIDTGQKTPPRKGIEYNAEANALQEQRDALREMLQKIEGKTEISDEQKIRVAIASANRWADEYERRIREKDFSPLRKKANTPITPELETAKKRLMDMKSALKDMMDIEGITEQRRLQLLKDNIWRSIIRYRDRIASKDYAVRKPKEKPQMDKDALALEALKVKFKDKFDIEMEKARLKNRPLSEKLTDTLIDVINLPKSLLASADLSAPLRQGAILSFSHPKIGIQAGVEMFRQAFSPKRAEEWLNHVKVNPEFYILKQSKLYVSEPTTRLSAKEEQFMTNIAHKIPIWGKIVQGSERAYVGYLNKLRVDVFLQGADFLLKEGNTFQNNPDKFKAWADFVNNATGRGNLGSLEGAAPVLNALFFAPRLVASRFNLINPVKYVNMPTEVRKMALRDMMAFVGVGMMVLAISKAAGADVEEDLRSSDFGKIKFGDFRFDIWAGFQQVVRMLSQVASGQRKSSTTGKITDFSAKQYPFTTRFDVVSQFMRGKLAPIPSLAVDVLEGETMMGEELKAGDILFEKTIPIYLQDMKQIYEEEGVGSMIGSGIPSLFGVGVQYYGPKEKDRVKPASVFLQEVQTKPEYKSIRDLYEKTNDPDAMPSVPRQIITTNSVQRKLSPQEYEKYVRLVDSERRAILNAYIKNPDFKNKSDEDKLRWLNWAWDQGQKKGKAKFLNE